jgi:rubrerythrin
MRVEVYRCESCKRIQLQATVMPPGNTAADETCPVCKGAVTRVGSGDIPIMGEPKGRE